MKQTQISTKTDYSRKHFFLIRTGIFIVLTWLGYSCTQKDVTLTTFKGDMIYSYLDSSQNYSEFVKIINRAGLKGMLSAYGDYSCLAPTNEAFRAYYKTRGPRFTIDSLTPGQIDTLAKTHIIPKKYLTLDLKEGVIPMTNMNRRYIEIKFTPDTVKSQLEILLNDSSRIVLKDHEVYNGVIQGINHVLRPSNTQLPDLMKNDSTLSIFSDALSLTGLSDSLRPIIDENYSPTQKFIGAEGFTGELINPKERRYGYTALVENNIVFRENGIYSLQDLIDRAKILYPGNETYNGDYTNRNNSLNKFIAYHLVNKAIYINKFFYSRNFVANYVPEEFIETMLPLRIIRASMINNQITLNTASDNTVHILTTGGKTSVNGVYHLLDKMLIYSEGKEGSVENMLQKTRIRFDAASLSPEMTNNNIRASEGILKASSVGDYYGFEQGYFSNVEFSSDTRLIYSSGKDHQWSAFESDKFLAVGAYDVTVRVLPVPPGTYEFRLGYVPSATRAITQIYFDKKPVGIPLNLALFGTDPKIGWIQDSNTDDNGYENDKMMRNRGYMKWPTIAMGDGDILRNQSNALRYIVGTFTFTEYSTHIIRFRSVQSNTNKECVIDWFELVPKAVVTPPDGSPESRD